MSHDIDQSKKREATLTAVGGLAAAAFAALASRVVAPRTALQDLRARSRIPTYGKTQKRAVTPFGYLGKEWAVLPASSLLAGKLWNDEKQEAAIAIVIATTAAIAASHVFDAALPQRTPPPGRCAPFDPHFPSGHSLHSGAWLLTAAYTLVRENVGDKRIIAGTAAALGVALGVDRLMQDRHWVTDIAGGWLAALSIAALTSAGYERATRNKKRERVHRRRPRSKAVA